MQSKLIKSKIRAVAKTHQVTKAMEAVSAVKMRKAQERALLSRPFALSALSILEHVSGAFDIQSHDLVKGREVKKTLMIIVTSDRGLAGNHNNAILNKTINHLKGVSKDVIQILPLGKKGFEYFSKRGWSIVAPHERMADFPTLQELEDVARSVLLRFTEGAADEVSIAYTNLLSTFRQEPVVRRILPLDRAALRAVVLGITPTQGKYATLYVRPEVEPTPYVFEPSAEEIFNELVSYLISIFLYHGVLEAKASEFSARMMAMKNAGDKAVEVGKLLNRQFNRARQSVITREVSEIIGGMETLSN